MQVSLYLKLAHELGVLPVACIHSAHPVVHQRPTLHATGLSLGRGEGKWQSLHRVCQKLLNRLGVSPGKTSDSCLRVYNR